MIQHCFVVADIRRKRRALGAFVLGALSLVACGGGGGTADPLPSGTAAQCFEDGLYASGTRVVIDYEVGGNGAGGSRRLEITVPSTDATFEGTPGLIELNTVSFDGFTSTVVSRYLKRTAPNVFAEYGSRAISGPASNRTTHTLTYMPALVDTRATLTLGASVSLNAKVTDTFVSFSNGTGTITSDYASTVKFAGLEKIAIKAGSYLACRFELPTRTEWISRGFVVKATGGDPLEMKSGSVNGAPL